MKNKKPVPYTGQSTYDGKRPLTPRQLERARETIRLSNERKSSARGDEAGSEGKS